VGIVIAKPGTDPIRSTPLEMAMEYNIPVIRVESTSGSGGSIGEPLAVDTPVRPVEDRGAKVAA